MELLEYLTRQQFEAPTGNPYGTAGFPDGTLRIPPPKNDYPAQLQKAIPMQGKVLAFV